MEQANLTILLKKTARFYINQNTFRYQPLENHQWNVLKLGLNLLWPNSYNYLQNFLQLIQDSQQLINQNNKIAKIKIIRILGFIFALRFHDFLKPKYVKIKTTEKGKISYSYSGHRFVFNDKVVLARSEIEEKIRQFFNEIDRIQNTFPIEINNYLRNLIDYINKCQDRESLVKSIIFYCSCLIYGHHEYSIKLLNTCRRNFQKNKIQSLKSQFSTDLLLLIIADNFEAALAEYLCTNKNLKLRNIIPFNISSINRNSNGDKIQIHILPGFLSAMNLMLEFKKYTSMNLGSLIKDYNEQKPIDISLEFVQNINRSVTIEAENVGQEGVQIDDLYSRLGFKIRKFQREVFKFLQIGEKKLILNVPTGSGKTEAVILAAICLKKSLIIIYPAKSLIEDQIGRIREYLQKLNLHTWTVLVDTGDTQRYFNSQNEWDAELHYYKADIILTSFDKFLYRFFGFGPKRKGFIFIEKITHNPKPIIVFDECHSYENVALTNFISMLEKLQNTIILMSATIPGPFIDRLRNLFGNQLNIIQKDATDKKFQFEVVDCDITQGEHLGFIPNIVSGLQNGERIIFILTKVSDAVEFYKNVKKRIDTDDFHKKIFLYHGRINPQIRRKIYQQLKDADSNQNPYLLITTSAIEVGCDLSSSKLYTQVCDPAQLIQRIGRNNRHNEACYGNIVIFGNSSGYINKIRQISQQNHFISSEFLKQFIRTEQIEINHEILVFFDSLFKYTHEGEFSPEGHLLFKTGRIITRNFEPSVEIIIDSRNKTKIDVPIHRTILYNKDQIENFRDFSYILKVNNKELNGNRSRSEFRQIQIIPINNFAKFYNPEYGLFNIPKLFFMVTSHKIRPIEQKYFQFELTFISNLFDLLKQ